MLGLQFGELTFYTGWYFRKERDRHRDAWLHYDTHRPAEGAVRAHVPQANVPRCVLRDRTPSVVERRRAVAGLHD